MSQLGNLFKTYLESIPELASLVGTRIFPNRLPDGTTLPAMTFSVAHLPLPKTHSGKSTVSRSTVTLKTYSETYKESMKLSSLVVLAVDNIPSGVGTTRFFLAQIINAFDYEEPETDIFSEVIEVGFHYTESL